MVGALERRKPAGLRGRRMVDPLARRRPGAAEPPGGWRLTLRATHEIKVANLPAMLVSIAAKRLRQGRKRLPSSIAEGAGNRPQNDAVTCGLLSCDDQVIPRAILPCRMLCPSGSIFVAT
jgi:hypothetical protein